MSKRMQQWLAKKNKKQPEYKDVGGGAVVPTSLKDSVGEADDVVLKLAGVYK